MDAATIIHLIRDAQVTLHTEGGRVDLDGKSLIVPPTINAAIERRGEALHVSLSPPVTVDKAASWLWFDFNAEIHGLQITPQAIFAMTNRGRYKIMEAAEPA